MFPRERRVFFDVVTEENTVRNQKLQQIQEFYEFLDSQNNIIKKEMKNLKEKENLLAIN